MVDQPESFEDRTLPPRRAVHPSNKGRFSRGFYIALLILFFGLTAGLTIWGAHYLGN